MIYHSLKRFVFVLAILNCLKSQNVEQVSSTPALLYRLRDFKDAFATAVKSSPHMLQVFDVVIPSSEASAATFQSCQTALRKVDSKFPVSLAKSVADAMYLTFPFIQQDSFIYAVSSAMGSFLISQNLLTRDNPSSKAKELVDEILANYPVDGDVSHFAMSRALSEGLIGFIQSQGPSVLLHAPSFSIMYAKNLFAYTPVSEPFTEVTIVAPPGTIPSACKAFGISSFSSTFLAAVDSSPTLQSIFYSNLPALELSYVWQSAANEFCKSINCLLTIHEQLQTTVSRTYNFMSKSMYVKSISSAYGILLIELGTMNSENSSNKAYEFAKTLETLAINLLPDADFQTKFNVIFTAFNHLLGTGNDIQNLYSAFVFNIMTEFYAATPVISDQA